MNVTAIRKLLTAITSSQNLTKIYVYETQALGPTLSSSQNHNLEFCRSFLQEFGEVFSEQAHCQMHQDDQS